MPLEVWVGRYLIAVLDDEATVRGLTPDLAALNPIAGAATGGRGNVGVAAVAAPGAAYDVVNRFFAPGSGIPEDPATGSLHCILAPAVRRQAGPRHGCASTRPIPAAAATSSASVSGDRVLLRGRRSPWSRAGSGSSHARFSR